MRKSRQRTVGIPKKVSSLSPLMAVGYGSWVLLASAEVLGDEQNVL